MAAIIPPRGEEVPEEDPMAGGTPGAEFRQPGQSAGNEITAEVKKETLNSAPPEMKSSIQKIVAMGRRIMFDPKTHENLISQFQRLQGDIPAKLAQGAAALLTMCKDRAKGPFPIPAMAPAGVIILMEVIEFFEESGKLEVTPDLVAEATQQFTGYLMKKGNIGPKEIEMARNYKGGPELQPPPEQPQQQAPQQQPQPTPPPGIIGRP